MICSWIKSGKNEQDGRIHTHLPSIYGQNSELVESNMFKGMVLPGK